MGKGRKAKAVTPAPPSKPLPAQGRGGHKRTPTSAFDPAAGQEGRRRCARRCHARARRARGVLVGAARDRHGPRSAGAYWKLKETTWPKLAKMAKQYLAAPFSSAGVERVFSAAGKMHDDLRKSEKDSTLEHSLFAAFDCE